jgi:transposase
MPHVLTDLDLDEISVVDSPSNAETDPLTGKKIDRARIALWKRDSTPPPITKEKKMSKLKTILKSADASRDQIATSLYRFYHWCAYSDLPELHTLATTVETWWPGIEAFLATGITNARTEGLNRLVKQVKRSACGFRNPANGHRRIRFHCTRTQRAATAASRTLPAQV